MQAAEKPFNASLRIGGLYDTRVGAASTAASDEDLEDSGFALRAGLGYQFPIEGDFGFRIDYGGYADFHQDYSQYDVIDQSISFEPQYETGDSTFSLPFAFNYVFEDGNSDYKRYTAAPTYTYLIPSDTYTITQAIAAYATASIINDIDRASLLDEDGKSLGIGFGYLIFFENASRIRLSIDYQHTNYDSLVVDYESASTDPDSREDDILVLGLDGLYQINTYFGIFGSYAYISSDSNVKVYDYNRQIIEAGISLRY